MWINARGLGSTPKTKKLKKEIQERAKGRTEEGRDTDGCMDGRIN